MADAPVAAQPWDVRGLYGCEEAGLGLGPHAWHTARTTFGQGYRSGAKAVRVGTFWTFGGQRRFPRKSSMFILPGKTAFSHFSTPVV
jgi:hypothetical protein